MNRNNLRFLGLVCALGLAASFAWRANANAADEVKRLAVLMQWKLGMVVADIGAGDGEYSFAAVPLVGVSGKVFATEIDEAKLAKLREEVVKRKLQNVVVVESGAASTNLAAECCDAIFLRRVYHHLTKPAEFDAEMVRSLKPGGRLAIIDFPTRAGLEPVAGVPSNRGGHGIPQKVVIEELTAAGLHVEKIEDDWPGQSYCILFVKK